MITRRNFRKAERGQTLVLCAIFMAVLLLFVGLALDFGMAYVTRAQIGKAADAASLTAARYSAQGPTKAAQLAQNAFNMNYGSSSLAYGGAPVVNVTQSFDSSGDTLTNVTVTATNKTFFAGLLPAFASVNVASRSQSFSRRVVMTLVLDRTGSMLNDGGSSFLAGAVTDFIGYFNNKTDVTGDNVALVSFANDVTVDVPMTTGNFQQAVINDAAGLKYQGATWSDGALQNALFIENAFVMPPAANLQKVVVFFTDGNANTIQNNLTCTGRNNVPSGTWNIGGDDSGAGVGFVSTSNASVPPPNYPLGSNPNSYYQFQYDGGTSYCNGTFTTLANKQQTINWANVSGPAGDARARALADAFAMRAAGIAVYAIGLGNATQSVDPIFLCEIANDPCSPLYDANSPVGAMEFASTAATLDQAFQSAASAIRLKLTQ